ncbi:hypothetical protein MG293_011264 [Ovis ammon polii]|uniref:Uncharacterized protein n=1 Tax=Ovis ammon polii TaxID=230172 RepID=A0AAD4U372_OVIAM|nr:hypothetical protein MG293_011264 [Ovis ammon polii]
MCAFDAKESVSSLFKGGPTSCLVGSPPPLYARTPLGLHLDLVVKGRVSKQLSRKQTERRAGNGTSVTRCAMCYSLCGGDRDEPGSPLAAAVAAAAAAAAAPAAAARTPSPRAHPGTPERSAAAGPIRPRAP